MHANPSPGPSSSPLPHRQIRVVPILPVLLSPLMLLFPPTLWGEERPAPVASPRFPLEEVETPSKDEGGLNFFPPPLGGESPWLDGNPLNRPPQPPSGPPNPGTPPPAPPPELDPAIRSGIRVLDGRTGLPFGHPISARPHPTTRDGTTRRPEFPRLQPPAPVGTQPRSPVRLERLPNPTSGHDVSPDQIHRRLAPPDPASLAPRSPPRLP